MRGKKTLISSLIAALFVISLAIVPSFATTANITAPIIEDLTYVPGSVFTAEIVANDVSGLWGFSFDLEFDPEVVAILDIDFGPHFWAIEWQRVITPGRVTFAASGDYGPGLPTGTWILARITIRAESLGTAILDLTNTQLTDAEGGPPIAHEAIDGYFANIEPKFRVDARKASAQYRTWSKGTVGPFNTLSCIVRNFGTAQVETYVDFEIADSEMTPVITKESDHENMKSRKTHTFEVPLNANELPGTGKYYVTAKTYYYNVDFEAWMPTRKQPTFSFTLEA